MAAPLEPRIEAIRKKYELAQNDFWQIPQNGQWVCKHAALEVVATKAGIEWLEPKIIEANAPGLVTSMIVTGKLGDRVEWATGETNPTNYSVKGKQPAYPWAMSEKRAKDRVILKLSGVHGLLYSDAEVDAPGGHAEGSGEAFEPLEDSVAKTLFPVIQSALMASTTTKQLEGAWSRYLPVMSSFSDTMQANCDGILDEMRRMLDENGGDARKLSRDSLEADLRTALSMDDLKDKWQAMEPALRKIGKDDVSYLSRVKEEMKAVIQKLGGTMPEFDHLDTSSPAVPAVSEELSRRVKIAQTP